MKWADCEAAWKRQEVPPTSEADVAALEASFESKRRQMASARFVRKLIEGSTGPIVCVGLAIAWWIRGRGGWPTAFAILLIISGFGLSWLSCARSRRSRPGADAPLLVKLDADIAELQRERRRLLTMRTWYFGPVYAAILIIPFVLLLKHHAGDNAWFAIDFALYYAAISLLSWAHNRREVRRRLDPYLDELEKLRHGVAAREP